MRSSMWKPHIKSVIPVPSVCSKYSFHIAKTIFRSPALIISLSLLSNSLNSFSSETSWTFISTSWLLWFFDSYKFIAVVKG